MRRSQTEMRSDLRTASRLHPFVHFLCVIDDLLDCAVKAEEAVRKADADWMKASKLAYIVGTYQMSFKGPDGKPASDNGKTIEIWKKQADGSWKCIVDGYSSDLPPLPTPAASK